MEFLILGPTVLRIGGSQVPLGVAKQRALLALLLYHAPKPVRVDVIVDLLWGGQRIGNGGGKLHSLVSRTRALLRGAGLPNALIRDPGLTAYRLDVDRDRIDLHRFRRLCAEARAALQYGRSDHAAALLAEAVNLWRGDPLAELRGAQVESWRRDLQEKLLDAQYLLAESLLATRRHEDALNLLEQLVATNPTDEEVARLWVMGLISAGRERAAAAFVSNFVRRYRKDFGTAPAVDLRGLMQKKRVVSASNGDRIRSIDTDAAIVPPRQLPNDIQDFTGHVALIAQLDQLLTPDPAKPNVVVLTGPPGVGKTTLARHWAFQRQSDFPDGQLYLNAEGHSAAPTVPPADALRDFLTALGVPPEQIPVDLARRRERFNQLVSGRRMLIVLDNVLDSEQARPLLPASATCLTVVTCRNRLTDLAISDGIGAITVPILPVAERLALLSQIVGRARAGAQPAAVRTLAILSGGFPLALRIIGEHVSARPKASIDELVGELATRLLDCEVGEDANANLRTVFAWSYQALQPVTARLFRLLGLFAGVTVDAGAAGALLGVGHAEAERELNTLARAHLINHDTTRRYRLHDLLRRYAADCGRTEESAASQRDALRGLLDWYLLSAVNAATLLAPEAPLVPDLPAAGESPPMIFATEVDAMRWCEAERTNLIELTRSAVAHGFQRHGWQIPGAVREIFERFGRQDDVLAMLRMALAAAEADGHPMGHFGTLVNLGATHFDLRDYQEAARRYEEALRMAHRTGDPLSEAHCLHNIAAVYARTGRPDDAVETFERALEICDRVGDLPGRAHNLRNLAGALGQCGRYDQAVRCYQEALRAWEEIGSPRHLAGTHGRLAALYLRVGQPRRALTHCVRALTLHRRVRDEGNRCDVLTTAADARRVTGAYANAIRESSAAVDIAEEIGDVTRRAKALVVLADTLAAMGDHAMAYDRCQEGLDLVDDIDDPEMHDVLARLLALEARVTRAKAG